MYPKPVFVSSLARSFTSIAASETLANPREACKWAQKSAERWDQLRAACHKGYLLTTEQHIIAQKTVRPAP